LRSLLHCIAAVQYVCRLVLPWSLLNLPHFKQGGRSDVDLALKLDVLAVCAVFAFVGAILLGAF
jgi:hypothetical protein